MAAFIGYVRGNRGEASRTGSKSSGFKSTCQSYDGSVNVEMRYDKEDNLRVEIETSDVSAYWGNTVFRGTIEELNEIFETAKKIQNGELKVVKVKKK